jgi:hypothetical protein
VDTLDYQLPGALHQEKGLELIPPRNMTTLPIPSDQGLRLKPIEIGCVG